LGSVIFIILAIIITIFIGYRTVLTKPEKVIAAIPKGANLSIDKVHQESIKDGRKEWILDASSAHYLGKEKKVVFNKLSVVFYMEDKREVRLTADKGILKTDTSNMEAVGNVVVTNEEHRIKTEKLSYDHKKRVLFSETPVDCLSGSSTLFADTMFLDLNENQVTLEGNVIGDLSGQITL
jgi:LPS export ABC transporter protein LptC